MRSLEDYLALVPPLNAGDANFMAEVALCLEPFADIQTFLQQLPAAFDLDNAIGVQLDATGAWIGQSRNIPVPILNPWFSWDTAGLGWDQGYWWGPYEGTGLATLDDTTYRRLLRAKILANNCDGKQASILACITEYLNNPAMNIAVVDLTDFQSDPSIKNISLTMGVIITGQLPNAVDLSIINQLLIPFAPAGVGIDWAVTTINNTPVFGFDLTNSFVSGWDTGAWGASPAFVATNVVLG